MSKRSCRTMCCVVGCSNRYCNTEKSVRFYSFPSRPHEMDLKTQWILAVNRKQADGTMWMPTKSSRICSKHFVGGRKSQHPASPAYLPSIFPEYYRRDSTVGDSLKRLRRLKEPYHIQDKRIDCDQISPEPDSKEGISMLIKEEPLNEEPHNSPEKMVDSDRISPERGIREDISRVIKEEPLIEEIFIKGDPDDIGAVKIEQHITAMIVPIVERKMSSSESNEDFGRDVNNAAKNVFDDIAGSLKNVVSCVKNEEPARYSQQNEEGRLQSPSRYNLSNNNQESSSSTCKEVTSDCESLDVISPSYIENCYLCNECGKSFATHKVLKNHQKRHSIRRSYDSNISRTSSARKSMQQEENIGIEGQLPFACGKCNRSFDSYIGLQKHKACCRKVSKWCCCDELGIPCSLSSNTNNQKHSLNPNLPFCCCVCGKYFLLKKRLISHMVTHSEEKPYNCAQCRHGFKRRIGLIRHLVIHKNVKLYTCSKCSRDFRRKYDVKLHMTVHSDERPFTCNDCGQGFKRRQDLCAHRVIHNTMRSFS